MLLIKAWDIDARLKALKERRGETEEQFDAMLARASRERPTPAQAAAGNYKKPRMRWHGLEIAIEQPKGTVRQGVDETGKAWKTTFQHAYGYFCQTEGVDGDEVDVYLGPDPDGAAEVYIVRQMKRKKWDTYDEDKCFVGFPSEAAAKAAYLDHYDDPRFFGSIKAMPVAEFVEKVKATRGAPKMIKALVLFKGHVGAYLRNGKLVNLTGYQGRSARAVAAEGQQSLFPKPESQMKFGEHNPYRDKDPVLDTIDLFTGETLRDTAGAEHRRLEAMERSRRSEAEQEIDEPDEDQLAERQ